MNLGTLKRDLQNLLGVTCIFVSLFFMLIHFHANCYSNDPAQNKMLILRSYSFPCE